MDKELLFPTAHSNPMPYVPVYLLQWGLYGALCVQVYLYYVAFPNDRSLNKRLVYGIYVLETVHTAILSYDGFILYTAFVPGRITASDPTVSVTLEISSVVLGSLVVFVVHIFYAYRICLLSQSKIVLVIVIPAAAVQVPASLLGNTTVAMAPGMCRLLATIWYGGNIVCDASIAILMVYHLLQRDTEWRSTHKLLMKLVRLAIETGLVTMLIMLPAFVLALMSYAGLVPAQSYAWFAILVTYALPKLYSNAMMANFNHRIHITGGRTDESSTQITLPSNLWGMATRAPEEPSVAEQAAVSRSTSLEVGEINVQARTVVNVSA